MTQAEIFHTPRKHEQWAYFEDGAVAEVVTVWNSGPHNNGVVVRWVRGLMHGTRYTLAEFLQRFVLHRPDLFEQRAG